MEKRWTEFQIKVQLVVLVPLREICKKMAYEIWTVSLFGPRWAWLQAHKWAWFGGLFLGGFTVAGENEFGLAAILFVLGGISCASSLIKWNSGDLSKAKRRLVKSICFVFILFVFTYAIAVDNVFRAGRAWSQFPKALKQVSQLIYPDALPKSPKLNLPPNYWIEEIQREYSNLPTAKNKTTPKLTLSPGKVGASELEKPIDLTVSLSNPLDPAISITNVSDSPAENISWEVVMYRTSDLSFFSFATQQFSYVKAGQTSAKYTMSLPSLLRLPQGALMREGDEFIGSMSIDCAHCKGNTIMLGFVWGKSGWFFDLPNGNGKVFVPNGNSNEKIANVIAILQTISVSYRKEEIH